MKVTKQIKETWDALWEHGDIKEIAEYANAAEGTVRKALREGHCSEKLFRKICAFYDARKKLLEWK